MLHWVAQINVLYVVTGLEAPPNVFWDQPKYRQFVAVTKEACQGLMKSAREVPFCNDQRPGQGQEPLWLGQPQQLPLGQQEQDLGHGANPQLRNQQPALQEAERHSAPGAQSAPLQQQALGPQPSAQQNALEGQQLDQPLLLQPAGLQGQSRVFEDDIVPDTQDSKEQEQNRQPQSEQQSPLQPHQQSHTQQQQQQRQYGQWQHLYQSNRAGQQTGQQQLQQQQRSRQQAQLAQGMGVNELSSRPLRHSASLSAAAAVPLPGDDKPMPDAEAGTAADTEAAGTDDIIMTHAEAAEAATGPIGFQGLSSCLRRMFYKHQVDLKAVLDHTCQAALALLAKADVYGVLEKIARDVRAGWPKNASALCMQRIKAFTAPAPRPQSDTAPAYTSPAPARPAVQSPAANSPVPARPAVNSPTANSPAPARPASNSPGADRRVPATAVPWQAPSHPPAPSNAPLSSTAISNNPGHVMHNAGFTSPNPMRAAYSGSAQQALAPIMLFPAGGTAFHSPAVNSPAAAPQQAHNNQGRGTFAPATFPVPGASAAYVEPFTPEQVANLSDAVQQQLCHLVSNHRQYVRGSDFDWFIMRKLASLPESQALHVLQQLDQNVSWPNVQNKTKYIMFFCCNTAS